MRVSSFYFHNHTCSTYHDHQSAKGDSGLERAGQWLKVTQREEVEASRVVLPLQGPETELPPVGLLDQLTTYPRCLNRELRKMKKKEQIRSLHMLQGPHFPASSPQLGLKSSVIHPCGSPGPIFLTSMHIGESFPRVSFFLRVSLLLEEKVFFTVICVCLCRSLVEVFQRLLKLFSV